MKPPTEQELRELALEYAERIDTAFWMAKSQSHIDLNPHFERRYSIISAALDRWADEMKEEREHAEWMSGVDRFAKSVFKSIKNKGTK